MSQGGFIAANWPAPANIVAGTTRRTGGVSEAPYADFNFGAHVADEPGAVVENRNRLRQQLDLPAEPSWLRQVHGNRVVVAPFDHPELEADACIALGAGIVCAVLTADCLPVLFATKKGDAVAAAHAGWRGLHAGVLEATVRAFDCEPGHLIAWFGPAISQKAFEVGDEVREEFVLQDPEAACDFEQNAAERWQADLYGLARRRLNSIGVTDVFGGDRCTYAEESTFFSYRRDGRCGRMASLIFRRN